MLCKRRAGGQTIGKAAGEDFGAAAPYTKEICSRIANIEPFNANRRDMIRNLARPKCPIDFFGGGHTFRAFEFRKLYQYTKKLFFI